MAKGKGSKRKTIAKQNSPENILIDTAETQGKNYLKIYLIKAGDENFINAVYADSSGNDQSRKYPVVVSHEFVVEDYGKNLALGKDKRSYNALVTVKPVKIMAGKEVIHSIAYIRKNWPVATYGIANDVSIVFTDNERFRDLIELCLKHKSIYGNLFPFAVLQEE